MWTLGQDQTVIPGVAFIRYATARPPGTVGSLGPTFVPARPVRLAVKLPCCPCALRPIAIRPAGTIGRRQGGISRSPPPGLAPQVLRLPPILHKPRPRPTTSWSKAPRGLFVLPRVAGIFTGIPISPSPLSRQRPDRSTFRAGRNLPDKEFRYLRTVIVTAAVYRGFGSPREQLPLTFRHWAGLSPYTSTLAALAGTGVFGKQTPGPGHCGPLTLGTAWVPHATRGAPSPEVTGPICRVP